ncbi:MFS general substrate transporter [Nadsonia fulvescens var. elongata DSM 6958]|uniref:MFS general substrate transporter n=1 Tax=Nadsonia fulvescens var. elongata DSM 6958 TaxID=857566 RepID=A0A1E3PDF4_9ASCO|nr:MFS general substrate transporter [Nadsonia fulvescens var. elongata DSM 6958]
MSALCGRSEISKTVEEADSTPVEIQNLPSESKDIIKATTSIQTNVDFPRTEAVTIPRSRRRGLLGPITLLPEVDDPYLYSNKMKNTIIFIIAFASMIGPMGTSIILPAMTDIAIGLQTSRILTNVAFGIYLLAMGIFPLWWSRMSEFFGRRSIYVISFGLYVVTSIGCALSTNIGMFIAFRILAGGSSASVQSLGAGTIGDIYVTTERGRAAGWYYLGPLAGPLISPVIGGLLTQRWGWRSTQWFCTILSGCIFLMILVFLPETLKHNSSNQSQSEKLEKKPRITSKPIQQINEQTETNNTLNKEIMGSLTQTYSRESRLHLTQSTMSGDIYLGEVDELSGDIEVQSQYSQSSQGKENTITESNAEPQPPKSQDSSQVFYELSLVEKLHLLFISPMRTLRILRYPPVFLSIMCSTYCFFCLYLMNIRLESTFSRPPYNFSNTLVGLIYLPNSVSYIVASLINGSWSDKNIKRSIAKHGKLIPEKRIAINVYLGSIIYPASLIFFGWTSDKKVFWLVPLIGTFCFGAASMILFGTFLTYLVDALPGRGSSGVALNNLCRMTGAFIASFTADPLAEAMGSGWMFTMWSLIAYFLIGLLILIKKRGDHWRATSPRLITQIILFVVLILLIFLYTGCSSSPAAFSNLQLIKYSYSPAHGYLETIGARSNSINSTLTSSVEVRAGFSYVCVAEAQTDVIVCAHQSNLTALDNQIPTASLTTSNGRVIYINLIDLAASFMTKIIHPTLPFAAIILVALALATNLWASLPLSMSFKAGWASLMAAIVTFVACIVWSVATIWIFVATRASTTLINEASVGLATASTGIRAAVMAWFSFAGLIIATGLACFLFYSQNIARVQIDIVNAMNGKA